MKTYTSAKELRGNILQRGDIVIFPTLADPLVYEVWDSYLNTDDDGRNNDSIFDYFQLDCYDFCEIFYGYYPSRGTWPEVKNEDYEALTRVVLALLEVFNAKSKPINVNGKDINVKKFIKNPIHFYKSYRLNDNYTATCNENGIVVGCQTIPYENFIALFNAATEAGFIKIKK